MAGGGEPEGVADPEPPGDAAEAGLPVEVHVLAGVDDVEPGDPEQHGLGQEDRRPGEVAAQGDPGGDRRQAEREPQPEVGQAGESLGVGIAQEPEQYGDREDRAAIDSGRNRSVEATKAAAETAVKSATERALSRPAGGAGRRCGD